jgi:methionyl aminopeptidase
MSRGLLRRGPDIEYKTPEQIQKMRAAGLVVAAALAAVRDAVAPGVSTGDLDAIAERVIRDAGAVPSFLGYQGYPATICSSVNSQVVHAIPSGTQVLHEGDLISIDCGAILDGWHGDSAVTLGVGRVAPELTKLASVTEDALWAGLAAAATGSRLTDISHAVEQSVNKAGRFGIVDGYGGHGIGTEMHQDPHVLNHGRPGRGPAPRAGPGARDRAHDHTGLTPDGRALRRLDRGHPGPLGGGPLGAHVAIMDDGVWVLTAADGGLAASASSRAPPPALELRRSRRSRATKRTS